MGLSSSKEKKQKEDLITSQTFINLLDQSKAKCIQYRNEIKPNIEQKKNKLIDLLKKDQIIMAKITMRNILQDEDHIKIYDSLISILENIREKCDFKSDKECPLEIKNNLNVIIFASNLFKIDELISFKEKIIKKYGNKCHNNPENSLERTKNEEELLKKLSPKDFSEEIIILRLKQLCQKNNIESSSLNVPIPGDDLLPKDLDLNNINTYKADIQTERIKEVFTGHKPIPMKIANKIIKSICKITIKLNNTNKFGTGFFMNISDSFKSLVTNYHVINEKILNENIEIEIWNEKKTKLNLNNHIYKCFEEPIDITIIEMKDSDEIYKYIEFLDYDINYIKQGYLIYKDADVFSIEHPGGEDAECASGKIIKIYNYEFDHNIPTDKGSSGCPILLLSKNINFVKIIGIHKNSDPIQKINGGTFIGEIIKVFDQSLLGKKDYLFNKKYNSNIITIDNNNIKYSGNDKIKEVEKISIISNKTISNKKDLSENITKNINLKKSEELNFIYKNLINSLNCLKHNNLELSSNETIKNYLSLNSIIRLKVYIIETSNLHNFFIKIKQSEVWRKDNSLFLSKNDIISPDKISEQTKYSFINEEICKFVNMNNLNDSLKTFLFVNQKNIYIYYQNQNILANVFNYQNNTFNLNCIGNNSFNNKSQKIDRTYNQLVYKEKKLEECENNKSIIEGWKRLYNEFRDLNHNPISSLHITVGLVKDNDIYKWIVCLLGPKDTPYANGIFYLHLIFPKDYPEKCPEIVFLTRIYHLNVNPWKSYMPGAEPVGHVSVSFINWWKPETTPREILTRLYSIFYCPNPESCYGLEREKEFRFNRSLYMLKVCYFTKKYANYDQKRELYNKT